MNSWHDHTILVPSYSNIPVNAQFRTSYEQAITVEPKLHGVTLTYKNMPPCPKSHRGEQFFNVFQGEFVTIYVPYKHTLNYNHNNSRRHHHAFGNQTRDNSCRICFVDTTLVTRTQHLTGKYHIKACCFRNVGYSRNLCEQILIWCTKASYTI